MHGFDVKVKGIVQGVGFRPFVYNLALELNLKGWVNNDDRGVNIHLQGEQSSLDRFLEVLKNNPPPLSKIDTIEVSNLEATCVYDAFEIIESQTSSTKSTIISPDIAVCDDCINDINDENNFRFEYALTNCTNCGPRYSIIQTVPYDRANTSMREFKLCPKCQKEYTDPTNRRYHAQPVACEACGPKVRLYDKKNQPIYEGIEAIQSLAQLINQGEIVAMKGMGGFHLVCDATNSQTIQVLRERKNRPNKPFAVMFDSIESIENETYLLDKERELITSKEKPITLVKRKEQGCLSQLVAPMIDRLGCFIAYTPLHILLFKHLKHPIVATSANLSDEPIICEKDEVYEKLGHVVDYVLDFNREIINACDDSVVQVINNDISLLRNARGYAPTALKLDKATSKKILALGANQKSTIALAFEDNLILSPHIGDLNSIASMQYFIRTIETFNRFYDFKPDLLVCDKHPNYETTKWAKAQGIELIQIQHHYAHVLSTMAEYGLKERVLAFAFDGTGYGDDGNIWGGEVFICDNTTYHRAYHFEYFRLLGGEKAVKEPKRVALSLLFENYSLEEVLTLDVPTIHAFKVQEIKLMHTMWQKGLNAPQTSSLGRLFDAIASFAGIAQTQSYEGETGLQIEMAYDSNIKEAFEFKIENGKIDFSLMIQQIVKESDTTRICSMFINMLVEVIIHLCEKYDDLSIVLTGGVFQNKTLLERVSKRLDEMNRTYYYSKKVPLNDGGIAMGQLYYAL